MAGLSEISGILRQNENQELELSEISTRQIDDIEIRKRNAQIVSVPVSRVRDQQLTPQDCLTILRGQPDEASLIEVIRRLTHANGETISFSLYSLGPLQAQIIGTLVENIIPAFWPTLSSRNRDTVLHCLDNVAGINAIFAHIGRLNQSSTRAKISEGDVDVLTNLLNIVQNLFRDDTFVLKIWEHLSEATPDSLKSHLAWKNFVTLVGSGKIPATIAQAEDVLKAAGGNKSPSWLASGVHFSSRLGRAIGALLLDSVVQAGNSHTGVEAAAQLLGKAFGMNYTTRLVSGLLWVICDSSTLVGIRRRCFIALNKSIPVSRKRLYLESIVRWLSSVLEDDSNNASTPKRDQLETSTAVALLREVLADGQESTALLADFCSDAALLGSVSFRVRRVCICTLADLADDELEPLLEKLLKVFGGHLFIEHAALHHQECLAQMILLTAGYLHRTSPMSVLVAARSSGHMQGVSNRLESSNQRARWLGMVVGTAMSSKVDKAGSKMSFGTDDMLTTEAQWYFDLIDMEDKVYEMEDVSSLLRMTDGVGAKRARPKIDLKSEKMPILDGKPVFGPVRPPVPAQTEIVGAQVTEVLENDEDDGIPTYAKPDSDPEDSDEDATLVKRNKPRPPVYIRDLMTMLRDDKDPEKFGLAVKHGASLIRRKANFGREVTDHAEEIATIFCGLQDPFETEDFDMMKLQGLIAVLLSDVPHMAPWLSKQAFVGDYSIAQRCIMLSALGLGGRELAGLVDQDVYNQAPPLETVDFPTKRLPQSLHATYSTRNYAVRSLDAASKKLEHHLIEPMALSAADKQTSHLNAVKVRTFSSRMDNHRTNQKPKHNQLAKVFGESFFFPLMSRYQQDIAAYGTGSLFASTSFLLVTVLKTLSLLLHASGPATLHLSDITIAFWNMVLSLRVQAARDISVLEAVLFSILTLLETNEGSHHRFLLENSKQLAETQSWVEVIFERTGDGGLVVDGSDQETKVRMLAAGILVKARELVEAYQHVLMGSPAE